MFREDSYTRHIEFIYLIVAAISEYHSTWKLSPSSGYPKVSMSKLRDSASRAVSVKSEPFQMPHLDFSEVVVSVQNVQRATKHESFEDISLEVIKSTEKDCICCCTHCPGVNIFTKTPLFLPKFYLQFNFWPKLWKWLEHSKELQGYFSLWCLVEDVMLC